MLVLSRKVNEAIDVGGGIQIVVVDIRGDKVRLGIEAPLDVIVHRREVSEAIAAKKGSVNAGEEARGAAENAERCCYTCGRTSAAWHGPRCKGCERFSLWAPMPEFNS
jgi:carbon storage regulator